MKTLNFIAKYSLNYTVFVPNLNNTHLKREKKEKFKIIIQKGVKKSLHMKMRIIKNFCYESIPTV